MPSVPFTVTVQATPSIQVTGVNISYEELLNSFGAYWYWIEQLYLETFTDSQANEPIVFDRYNSDGTKDVKVLVPAIDPFGKQAAIYIPVYEFNFIIDSRLIITPSILPNSQIRYTFYSRRGFLSQKLDAISPSNKQLIGV